MTTQSDIAGACRHTLEQLIAVTNAIRESVERREFETLATMLEERERLLNSEIALLGQLEAERPEEGDALKQLAASLQKADKRLTEALEARKAELAAQLRNAQNQKRLTAYSR